MKTLTRFMFRKLRKLATPYLKSHEMFTTSMVFSDSAIAWEPAAEKVVVLAPHMDDETLGCGGTLRKHVNAGAKVTVAFLTDGSQGSPELAGLRGEQRARKEEQIAMLRKDEARKACDTLGLKDLVFFDARDGRLAETPDVATKLRRLLESIKPEIVYLPFFLEEHADHRAVSAILLEATACSALRFQCMGYEVWTPLFPNCAVRIDETLEIKKRAIAQYHSQLADLDYLHAVLGLNAYRSAMFKDRGSRYAESFYSVPLSDYRELFQTYLADSPAQVTGRHDIPTEV